MKKQIVIIFTTILLLSYSSSTAIMQPKWGNSDTMPNVIVKSNDFYQCRYNIKPMQTTQMDGTVHSGYYYDYIELKQVDRPNIIEALLMNECISTIREQTVIEILQAYKELR